MSRPLHDSDCGDSPHLHAIDSFLRFLAKRVQCKGEPLFLGGSNLLRCFSVLSGALHAEVFLDRGSPFASVFAGSLILSLVLAAPLQAQQFGDGNVITTSAESVQSVYSEDLDGDGDADVLAAYNLDIAENAVVWYENLGGGDFSSENTITLTPNGRAESVYAKDLDGDGDVDALTASSTDGAIRWYENLGGGDFSDQNVITTNADGAQSVYARDLDGDGDADVLSASANDDKIAWYENEGDGTFSDQKVITTSLFGAESVYARDLDGDSKADVLSAPPAGHKIVWYKNLGEGDFSGEKNVTTNVFHPNSVYARDLNGDSEADVLAATDKVVWYENLGGGDFSGEKNITTSGTSPDVVYAQDLDGDSDADVLAGLDGTIAWYENTGGGSFSDQKVISADGAESIHVEDLNGDEDADVLSASGDKIIWYENQEQGLPIASNFSYPVGGKINLPERITPETNDLYPDNPEADPKRESSDVGPYWRNGQDVGNYYSALGGLHAGEDWNWGSGTSDRGRAVYATANGQVLENDRIVSDSGPEAGGYAIIVEHEVPSGETYYSLYLHVVDVSSTDGEIEPPSVSGTVERGEVIARVGDVEAFSSHLDFQIRDTNWDPSGPLYPNSNPNGYYSHDGGIYKSGMTAQQVDDAFSMMREDGILDASDFIENRSEAPGGLTASSGDGEVTLSWNAPPESDLDGYNVYRSTSSFSDIEDDKKITDSPVGNTSYTDGAANGSTTYYYRVTAVPADGPESGPSGQASATLQGLKLLGLEVNQSVQTWENDVMPLVEGKKTIVRAHLQNEGTGSTPVNVKLRGTRDGSTLSGSPETAENADTYEAPSPPGPSKSNEEFIRQQRAKWSGSLNFSLPPNWREGTVTLTLMGENINCDETPEVNSNCEIEVTFEPTGTPKITAFNIGWEDETGTIHLPDYDITKVKDRLKAMYPISGIDITAGGNGIVIPCGDDEACGPPTKLEIFKRLYNEWEEDHSDGLITENHIYYGFVDKVKGGEGGSAELNGNVAFTATSKEGVPSATAHEIAHLHGLQHAVNEEKNGTAEGTDRPLGFCGSDANPSAPDFPYADSTRISVPDTLEWNGFTALGPTGEELNQEVWGVNTEEGGMGDVVASSPYRDHPNAELMSYCFGGGFGVLWASDTTYTTLRDSINARFGTDTAPTLASANSQTPGNITSSQVQMERGSSQEKDYLLVKGQIDVKEETLEFGSFTTVTTTPGRADAISPDPGSYTLQALDETGNVIREVLFKPSIPVTKTISEVGIFSVPLQADPAIEEVQVLGGGKENSLSGKSSATAQANSNVLGSKTASPNSPTVTVQYPNGQEDLSGDEVTLKWTADDADGDTLSYTVKYSRNGGSTWKALATSWPRDSLTVDASALGGTSSGLIRVQASDGFNTAEDQSDGTFGSSNVSPSASIFSPSDGAVVGRTGSVALDGSGSDTEDGSLSGSALKWRTASGDSLGAGETVDVSAANFSLGTHTIELVATDSVGASDTASVSIQVALSNDPSLLASASALVESDSLVDFGATGTNVAFDSTTGAATVTTELYDSAPIGADGIPQSNVSKYRILIAAGNGLSVGPGTEVRFETDTLGGIGDPTKVQIYRRPAPGNGPFEALDTQVDSMGTPDDSSDDVIFATVSGFGEFVLASDSEPLPVELSSFDATLDGQDAVRLTWTTASETGNAGFRVQRKAGEGRTWTTVGSVEGEGTTTEPTSYRYVDEGLPYEADRLTYRLKQVDTDGSASYSKEATVEREVTEAELLGTYPNPAQTRATIRYAVPERQDVTIHLYDILGRRVQTVVDGEREGRHKQQLDVSRLASGVYFLRLRAEGATKTQKLTVVR